MCAEEILDSAATVGVDYRPSNGRVFCCKGNLTNRTREHLSRRTNLQGKSKDHIRYESHYKWRQAYLAREIQRENSEDVRCKGGGL